MYIYMYNILLLKVIKQYTQYIWIWKSLMSKYFPFRFVGDLASFVILVGLNMKYPPCMTVLILAE